MRAAGADSLINTVWLADSNWTERAAQADAWRINELASLLLLLLLLLPLQPSLYAQSVDDNRCTLQTPG